MLPTSLSPRDQGCPRPPHPVGSLADVNREPHRTAVVRHRPLYGLADPPHHVGRKAETLLGSNFFTARRRPKWPSWMRSSKGSPRPRNFFATDTTCLMLASTSATSENASLLRGWVNKGKKGGFGLLVQAPCRSAGHRWQLVLPKSVKALPPRAQTPNHSCPDGGSASAPRRCRRCASSCWA